MGRIPLVIDKTELLTQIQKLESDKTFDNQSKLFDALCKTEWGKGIKDSIGRSRPISSANVYQYMKKYDLFGILKTPKGKRGAGLHQTQDRKTRAEKFAKNPKIGLIKQALTKEIAWVPDNTCEVNGKFGTKLNEGRLTVVNNIIGGSMKAAVKGMCLSCVGTASEAAKCDLIKCPLYLFNPFKKAEVEDEGEV